MLTTSHLMGFNVIGDYPSVMTLRSTASETSNASTYNYTSLALGPINEHRVIVAYIVSSAAGVSRTINSVTVDGIAAVQVGRTDSSRQTVAIWIAAPSANTTGTVSLAFSGSVVRGSIGVYSVANLKSTTAVDTGTDITPSGNAFSDTVSVIADGCAVGIVGYGGDTSTTTWTNLSEDYDSPVEGQSSSFAHSNFVTSSDVLITATYAVTPPADCALFIASFR